MPFTLDQIIDKLDLTPSPTVETKVIFRGYGSPYCLMGLGWNEVREWRDDGYRVVCANADMNAFITYCEGDLTLSVCRDHEAFLSDWKEADRFCCWNPESPN